MSQCYEDEMKRKYEYNICVKVIGDGLEKLRGWE